MCFLRIGTGVREGTDVFISKLHALHANVSLSNAQFSDLSPLAQFRLNVKSANTR